MILYAVKQKYSDDPLLAITETEEEAKALCNRLRWSKQCPEVYYEAYATNEFHRDTLKFFVSIDLLSPYSFYEPDDSIWDYSENTKIDNVHYIIFAKSAYEAYEIALKMYQEEQS